VLLSCFVKYVVSKSNKQGRWGGCNEPCVTILDYESMFILIPLLEY